MAQPKYQLLQQWLRDQINSREYTANQQIPTELELAEQFGYSRQTIRQAISGGRRGAARSYVSRMPAG